RARSCSSAAISTRTRYARASSLARPEIGTNAVTDAAETSLTEHVTSFELGAHVTGACFLNGKALFALGDGRLALREGTESGREIAAHDGSVLVCAHDAQALYTGGDDGRVLRFDASGESRLVAEEKGKWIDALTLSASGAIAWSAGHSVKARDKSGKVRET